MLNQPTSSPMMKTMFGFLPFCAWALATACFTVGSAIATSCPLVKPSEQQVKSLSTGLLGFSDTVGCGGCALALRNASSLPDAARKPSAAPIASMAIICTLVFLSIMLFLLVQGLGISGLETLRPRCR